VALLQWGYGGITAGSQTELAHCFLRRSDRKIARLKIENFSPPKAVLAFPVQGKKSIFACDFTVKVRRCGLFVTNSRDDHIDAHRVMSANLANEDTKNPKFRVDIDR
jgi:hypothetical protein